MMNRSSHSEVFCRKGVLRNFAKYTGKHLCQSLFFNKVACLSSATLLKKKIWHWCFPVNFAKFLKAPFFPEHFRVCFRMKSSILEIQATIVNKNPNYWKSFKGNEWL